MMLMPPDLQPWWSVPITQEGHNIESADLWNQCHTGTHKQTHSGYEGSVEMSLPSHGPKDTTPGVAMEAQSCLTRILIRVKNRCSHTHTHTTWLWSK